MSVLAAPALPIDAVPLRRSRHLITAGVVAVLVAVAGVTWFADRTSQAGGVITFYPSASFMAKRIGCRGTFRTPARPGGSSSAGECTTKDGARVEFRIYTTGSEASAWLDGARDQPSGRDIQDIQDIQDAGAVGGNWAVLITGTRDLKVIHSVIRALA